LPPTARRWHVHETAFRCDDLNPSAPGALAAVHRALVADDARNAQIVEAALNRGRDRLVLTRRVAHLGRCSPPADTRHD
jgi:hypothetical protein